MKYTVGVLVQGYAYAEIEANSNEEAYEKAMELEHKDFVIDYAIKNDEAVFTQSIFPEVFKKVTQECYMESMDAFSKLFEDKVFYATVMDAISREAYKNLRNRN